MRGPNNDDGEDMDRDDDDDGPLPPRPCYGSRGQQVGRAPPRRPLPFAILLDFFFFVVLYRVVK